MYIRTIPSNTAMDNDKTRSASQEVKSTTSAQGKPMTLGYDAGDGAREAEGSAASDANDGRVFSSEAMALPPSYSTPRVRSLEILVEDQYQLYEM